MDGAGLVFGLPLPRPARMAGSISVSRTICTKALTDYIVSHRVICNRHIGYVPSSCINMLVYMCFLTLRKDVCSIHARLVLDPAMPLLFCTLGSDFIVPYIVCMAAQNDCEWADASRADGSPSAWQCGIHNSCQLS